MIDEYEGPSSRQPRRTVLSFILPFSFYPPLLLAPAVKSYLWARKLEWGGGLARREEDDVFGR